MNVLIAGGSGLIGSALFRQLTSEGHTVRILTRRPCATHHVGWNPAKGEIDVDGIRDTEIVIHLSGESIAGRRWTHARKEELLDSRVKPIRVLWEHREAMPLLAHSISISGVNCYGIHEQGSAFREEQAYGNGFIDQLVRQWEEAAMLFEEIVPVTVLRMSVVLSDQGGAVEKLTAPIRKGFGAVLGSGRQYISWVHLDDVARIFSFVAERRCTGVYNVVAGNDTNKALTVQLARRIGKRIWLPPVPGFVMKLLFGEMSVLLLTGVEVSGEKLKQAGFSYRYPTLSEAVEALNP